MAVWYEQRAFFNFRMVEHGLVYFENERAYDVMKMSCVVSHLDRDPCEGSEVQVRWRDKGLFKAKLIAKSGKSGGGPAVLLCSCYQVLAATSSRNVYARPILYLLACTIPIWWLGCRACWGSVTGVASWAVVVGRPNLPKARHGSGGMCRRGRVP